MSEDERERVRKLAKEDQEMKEACLRLPQVWWSMYQEACTLGFTPAESMELIKSFILATGRAAQQ